MRTIVAPLDGSALAEQALPYVRLLAPLLHAGVCLLRAVSSAEIERLRVYTTTRRADHRLALHIARQRRARNIVRRRAQRYLAAMAAELRTDGLDVQVAVGVGAAAEVIIDAAQRLPSSLIVMSSHGWSGLNRWAIGSVTDKVLHATEAPVLIVRNHPPHQALRLRRIMLALDGSDLARQALPIAAELAGSAQAELILFQAIAPIIGAFPYPTLPADAQLAMGHTAYQNLEALADQLRPRRIAATPVVTLGYPAEAIVDEAERRDVDLIVMATHGWSGLRRWALGSVAGKVLHSTSRPLLLVRGSARG